MDEKILSFYTFRTEQLILWRGERFAEEEEKRVYQVGSGGVSSRWHSEQCVRRGVIYEQCVRAFWHSERYKDNLRYLKVWLEYADNCFDADVIYAFLDANGIGKTHSNFYIFYALHLESKNKFKAANQIFEFGISKNAQLDDKLKVSFRNFLAHSLAGPTKTKDDSVEKLAPSHNFWNCSWKLRKSTRADPFFIY
ncbi:mitotic spindle checkpoint protein BUBR1-like isoform X2 [Phaseolus vulgaris]|uniref:mitotic spindle checkpoint protein BUBR1-like isoform X2 n=1 Tax=Phaseolus vulgaris TaxID=3885 RepID=UPI0035C97588